MYTFKVTINSSAEYSQGTWLSPTEAAAEAIKHVVRNLDHFAYPAVIEIFEEDRLLFVLRFTLERPDLPKGAPE